jgi:hypothetical protein
MLIWNAHAGWKPWSFGPRGTSFLHFETELQAWDRSDMATAHLCRHMIVQFLRASTVIGQIARLDEEQTG